MRRHLQPEELGDFFDQPINAILAFRRRDGSLVQRPVWHRWEDDHLEFQIPAGDRKITMLERDPRVQVIVSENEYPYRTLEVRGHATLSSDRYHERAREIVARYVAAYDPGRPLEAYLSLEPGAIVEIHAEHIVGWDYADDVLHGASSLP